MRKSISGLSGWRKSLSLRGRETNGDGLSVDHEGSGRDTDCATVQNAPENKTIFQGFEWYTASSHTDSHWKRLAKMLPYLKTIGVTMIWIPPGSKAAHATSTGYDVYDLYDLGEFDQKGCRRTKWGSRDELLELADVAKKLDIGLMWDAVLNHKAGADETEDVMAVKCDPEGIFLESSTDVLCINCVQTAAKS